MATVTSTEGSPGSGRQDTDRGQEGPGLGNQRPEDRGQEETGPDDQDNPEQFCEALSILRNDNAEETCLVSQIEHDSTSGLESQRTSTKLLLSTARTTIICGVTQLHKR